MGESAVAAPSTNSDGHLGGMEDLSGENPAAATPMAPPIEYWDRRLATSYVQLLVDQQRLSLGTDVVERYDLDNLLYRDALRQAEREGYDVSHLHGPTGEAGDYHGRHRLEDLRPSAVTEDTWESAGVLGRLALIPEPEVVAAASHGQSDEVEAPPVARRRRTARAVGVLAMGAAAVKTGWAWAGAQVLRVRDWLSDKERDGERQRRRVVASVLGGAATILAIATGVYLANRGQHIPPASAGPGLPAAAPTPPVDLSLAYSGDTVWDGVSSFAHSQGVNLTGSELRDVVGRVLHDNHQTWASARYLPVGYRYVLSPAEINGLNTSE